MEIIFQSICEMQIVFFIVVDTLKYLFNGMLKQCTEKNALFRALPELPTKKIGQDPNPPPHPSNVRNNASFPQETVP